MIQAIRTIDDVTELSPAERREEGFGALSTQRGCLPLKALDVRARIAGLTSRLTVRQTFRNTLGETLEATYIFPLPDRAAVTLFRLRVGERVIEGQLKERSAARAEYNQAIDAGHRAAIAEEERSGTFNLRVGNIPPDEEVEVELTLVGPIPVAHGEATFRFPLVVSPRYVSGALLDGPAVGGGWGSDTDQVPDASRVTPPVLLPGFPHPVQLSLEVELDPSGLAWAADGDVAERLRTSLHSVLVDEGPPWTVRMMPGERLNRDFLLRFPVASSTVETSLICGTDEDGGPGCFALSIVPPAPEPGQRPPARDVVVVLDRSGSMGGWKMVAARRAVGRMIDTLLDGDRFSVLAFDHEIERTDQAHQGLVEATDRCRWRALEWLGKLEARGGTEMGPALSEALRLLAGSDATRQRVIVLVTDGQVAGEDAVLAAIRKAAGSALPRIHTLGIDRAVNAGFLRRLAEMGGGTCDLVESEDRLDKAMDHIHRTIGTPVINGLTIEPRDGRVDPESFAPSRLPDMYADRPVTLFGQYRGATDSLAFTIRGTDTAGKPWQCEITGQAGSQETLNSLWGRARVRDLEDRYAAGTTDDPDALAQQIVAVSLASHVLSRFTAYVAVDRSEVVNPGGEQTHIIQPVEPTDGWDMLGAATCRDGGRVMYAAMPLDCLIESAPRGFLPKRARRRAKPASAAPSATTVPKTPEDWVVEIERLVKKIVASWRRGSCRRLLNMLLDALRRLADTLGDKHPAHVTTEAAARRVEQMVRDYEAGDKSALGTEAIESVAAEVRAAADQALHPPTGPSRDRFWV